MCKILVVYRVYVYFVCDYILFFGAHASVVFVPYGKMLEVRVGGNFLSESRKSLAREFEITLSFRPLFKEVLYVLRVDEVEFL